MSEQSFIQVEASPTFNRNLRSLAKKYRNIRNDIQPVIEQLERGELLGDKISGIGMKFLSCESEIVTFKKERVVAYRLIYYVKTTNGSFC
jgi:mRNA-degrading endonuclease RelE of RelBE toxin-antitoxin system